MWAKSIIGHSISQWLPCPVSSWVSNTIGTWGGNSVKLNSVILGSQYGFRHKHSTEYAATEVVATNGCFLFIAVFFVFFLSVCCCCFLYLIFI